VYEGWYCVSCESFKQEKDLVDGQCPIHLRAPEWIREKNYFFRLSRYRDRLLAHFDAHAEFLQPEIRRNEIVRLLEGGLDDISISRAGQAWGIPLPFDPQSVVYVWFDALINYASAVGYATDEALCARWWPADLHVIGKDITRFHTVIWPAMLMSAGLGLPRQVFGHGWVHFKGQKMSKSLGTVVDPIDAADRLGPDPLRLFLVKEFPYGADGDFSWERFDERYNVDLANNLGNLVSRVSTMIERYRGGTVSQSPLGPGRLAQVAAEAVEAYRLSIGRLALQDAAAAAFRLVDATNEFIAQSEPWVLARQSVASDQLSQVLFDTAEAVRIAAVLLWPIMPDSSTEILRRAGEPLAPSALRFDRDTAWKGSLARRFERGASLWPRLGESAESAQHSAKEIVVTQESSSPSTPVAPPAPSAPEVPAPDTAPAGPKPPLADPIAIEDFMRIDLRVARILEAERVPKSKKLLKLRVDLGFEQRTIVAGIAEAYEPGTLIGRTIVVVANLKPATLMGIESNGMVLAGSAEGGKPELVAFVEAPPLGARVR